MIMLIVIITLEVHFTFIIEVYFLSGDLSGDLSDGHFNVKMVSNFFNDAHDIIVCTTYRSYIKLFN